MDNPSRHHHHNRSRKREGKRPPVIAPDRDAQQSDKRTRTMPSNDVTRLRKGRVGEAKDQQT